MFDIRLLGGTVYPKKYAHGFCFAVLCCGYTLTDFPLSIRLTSLALWQSNDCPSASKATLMNMDKYFMWIHYERLHNHNKAKHNKTCAYFLGYTVPMLPACRIWRQVCESLVTLLCQGSSPLARLLTRVNTPTMWIGDIYRVNECKLIMLSLKTFHCIIALH